jgi:ArsR family transcriptional regulator, arsenate/arsenite/antimonite-responsive transcriptional repressor
LAIAPPDHSIFLEKSLTIGNSLVISTILERMLMDSTAVVNALSALAQEQRLALFRLLVQAGEQGLPAGAIAETLAIPNSSLSFHLAALTRAGLIRQQRQSRSLIYSADYAAMNGVIGYLMENCCGGADCSTSARDAAPANERKSA